MHKDITTESLTRNFRDWANMDLLTEASVSQLMSSHDIPKSFAKHAKTKCSNGNVDFIIKVFLKNYKTMVENMTSESATERDKMLTDNYIMEFDRFMGYAGQTLDEYLKKHKGKKYRNEILELCEQGWTKFLKKMREYKKPSKENLEETRLNKTWKKRAGQRARRFERDLTKDDKKWAEKRMKKTHKEYPELEQAYLNEIESAMEAAKASKTYLETLRMLRKQKLEAKKKLDPAFPDKPHNRIGSSKKKPTHVGDIAPGSAPTALEEEEKNE